MGQLAPAAGSPTSCTCVSIGFRPGAAAEEDPDDEGATNHHRGETVPTVQISFHSVQHLVCTTFSAAGADFTLEKLGECILARHNPRVIREGFGEKVVPKSWPGLIYPACVLRPPNAQHIARIANAVQCQS